MSQIFIVLSFDPETKLILSLEIQILFTFFVCPYKLIIYSSVSISQTVI